MDQRRIIGLVAAAAVVAGGAVVVALNWPGSSPGAAGQAAPPPVRAKLSTVDLAPTDPQATSVTLPERATGSFSMLGITWTDPKAAPGGAVQVRTRSAATGAWSGWRTLDTDDSQGPDTGGERSNAARGGTAPLWVGRSDGVAARIAGATGKAAKRLPAGLRLDLIDPTGTAPKSGGQGGGEMMLDPSTDPSGEPAATPTPETVAPTAPSEEASSTPPATTAPATAGTTAPATAAPTPTPSPTPTATMGPMPAYVSRAAWNADESIVKGTPEYAPTAKVLFVHHTAGTNDYSCSDSPAIIRGILTYHVKSQGWNDIGYNFLVDKCGTLFEGRKGGVDKAVIGAHTYGFNTGSAGVAVLGTYITNKIPAVTQTKIAQLAAYKLGKYGYDPSTTAQLTEGVSDGKFPLGQVVTFQRISGHRDGVATECPGDALYAQLAAIRAQASSVVYGFSVKVLSGYVRGSVTLSWTIGTPSSLLSRFEIVVNGRTVSTVDPSARSATVTLAAGTNKLAVRAVHRDNTSLILYGGTVISDTTAPTFTRLPELALRNGTVATTSAPATLIWRAADNLRLSSVAVTTPAVATFGPTVTSYPTSTRVGVARTWKMTAKDAAGNVGAAATTRTATIIPETSAARYGSWTARSGTGFLNGAALTSSTRNAKLTFTFTGRSAALVMSRTPSSGQVEIYVDGTRISIIDLRGTTAYRQAVWARSFAGSTKHTVMVNVLATSGRPAVTVDGLLYLR